MAVMGSIDGELIPVKPGKHQSGGIFDTVNALLLGALAISTLLPFALLMYQSVTIGATFSFDAYSSVVVDPNLPRAFFNSAVRTGMGTFLAVFGCAVAAYPLSRSDAPFRRPVMLFITLTLVCSAGIVPTYLLIRSLGMLNTMWSLVLPGMLSAFNIIVIRNAFCQIPESFVEAARIDGAGDWSILFHVYLPLSKPVLATVALWSAVFHWNAWFDALLYISDDHKQVVQVMLQRIVVDNSTQMLEAGIPGRKASSDAIKAAVTVLTVAPIALLYPFVQRYFQKGLFLGGVKE